MKKMLLFSCILALCMSLGLTACGGEDKKTSSNKPPVQSQTPPANNGGLSNGGGSMDNGCAHSLTEEVIKEADCENRGEMKRSCSLCGESMIVPIPALGHDWSEYNSDRNGTLTENGTQTANCKRVGCTATNTIEEPNSKRENGIMFTSLKGTGTNLSATFENDETMFSFLNEVEIFGNATYTISYDLGGMDTVSTKTIPLNEGNNVVYVWEYVNGDLFNMYTVNLYRKGNFLVRFYNEGALCQEEYVLEGKYATPPTNLTEKIGYTFKGWSYDCSNPITESKEIHAVWEANTDTEYIVQYFYENIEDEEYTCEETEYLKGTTDEIVTAEAEESDHFILNESLSVLSGNIDGDGSLVLSVYYDREEYTVTFAQQYENYMYASAVGTHKYGAEISTVIDNVPAGFKAVWYAGETPFEMDGETYLIDRDFDIRIETRAEMANFEFALSNGECKITGVKDKTVTEIIVPDYVTRIEYGTFNGCSNVVSMELPFVGRYENAEGMQALFGYLFGSKYYEGAQSTSQSYYESTSTTSSSFYVPKSLTSVKVRGGEIPAFAFHNCMNLQEVTLGEGVTDVRESAFYNCDSLKEIVIPDSVSTIEGKAFYNCKELERVTIGDGVSNIGENAFYNCYALIDLTIGDSVAGIGTDAFYNCYALTRVTIGEKVSSIGSYAFGSCRKLVEIYNKSSLSFTIGGSDYGYVARYAKNIYTPTEGASKLSTDEKGYVLYVDGADTVLIGYTGTETELTLPFGVTEINQYAFYLAREITSVEIPDSVICVGAQAFSNCTNLTDVTIGDGVTDIGERAFYSCTNLSNITIGKNVTQIGSYVLNETAYYKDENNWNNGVLYVGDCLYTSNDTLTGEYTVKEGTRCIIQGAFQNRTGLTGISFPNSVAYIGDNAFYNCTNLTSVYITDLEDWLQISFETKDSNPLCYGGSLYVDGELLTELNVNCDVGDYAFYGYTGLTSLTIGNGATSIGERAFYGCSGLTDIVVSDSVDTVGEYAFYEVYPVHVAASAIMVVDMKKDNLETLTITSGDISSWLCSKASSLKSVELLDGVTSIGEWAFYNCSALTDVVIGSGVTSIGGWAFYNCSALTNLAFEGTVAEWEAISKGSNWKNGVPATEVVCSDGTVAL